MSFLSLPRASRSHLLAALLTLGAASFRAEAAPAAPTYTSKSDGYAIYLPGKPTAASKRTALPNGSSITANFITASQGALTFVVIPLKLPSAPNAAEAQQFLTGVQRGFTMSTAAKLISVKKISLGRYPGREVVVNIGTKRMLGRFLVAGNRSYQVLALSPQNSGTKYSAQIAKVMDSFRVLR